MQIAKYIDNLYVASDRVTLKNDCSICIIANDYYHRHTVFVMLANVTPICISDRLLSRVANIGVSNENSCYPIYIYFCSLESRVWVLGSNQKLQIHFTFKGLLFHLYGTEKSFVSNIFVTNFSRKIVVNQPWISRVPSV